jgi:hypothetical protein
MAEAREAVLLSQHRYADTVELGQMDYQDKAGANNLRA